MPYEELEGMFLDQFLIRFFHSLMPQVQMPLAGERDGRKLSPWECFMALRPWAKEMPLLFEQMTGYTLNEVQLNNAIAEYARRLSKSVAASGAYVRTASEQSDGPATPGPGETMETPQQSYTGM